MNNTDLIERLRDASRYNSIHGSWAAEAADALEAAQPAQQTAEEQIADLHDVIVALQKELKEDPAGEPVAQVHPANFQQEPDGKKWCRQVLLYSPGNESDKVRGVNTRVKLYTHPAPQVPSKAELADMRDTLFKMAEALQPHTQAMYDEAVFTGHMNMLDDSCHQCVTTLAEANKHYYFLRGYLSHWKPSQVPLTDKEMADAMLEERK